MNVRVQLLTLFLFLVLPACQNGSENDRLFDDPDQYVQYGNQYLRKRNPNFKAAINQYSLALDLDSNHYEALIGLGDASAFRAEALAEALESEQEETGSGSSGELRDSPDRRNSGSGEIIQETNEDMSVEERISALIKQAALAYGRAKTVRPNAALPYFKYGRLIYQFRERSPESIEKSKRLLSKALDMISGEKAPRQKAKILFFLGSATLYQEELKPEEKRDYSKVVSYFNRYLDVFDQRGAKAPRRAEIERLLMEIEEKGGSGNESSTDS